MSKKVRITCDYCGNEFLRFPSAVKERNFCSRACERKDRSKRAKSPENQERWHQLVLDFDA